MMPRTILHSGMLAVALLSAGCKQEPETSEPVRPVLSTIVQPSPAGGTIAAGTIEPRFKTDLSFRVLGRIISRPVNVGDLVGEGQTIADIDSTALELAVRSARADLARSQAQLANASAIEARKRTLLVSDATSKAVLDSAENARAGAQAAVARAEANLTKALEQLGYAELKADFAGVVTAAAADVGQVVSPGQKVVTVARPDIREAVVDIGADFPVPLRVGLPFTVSLQLAPAVQAEGEIREIAPEADPITRTRRVRIALHEPPASFRLGSTVTAKLQSNQHAVLRLPDSAVLTREDGEFVWVVELPKGTVSLLKVDVARDEAGLRVNSGLAAGTRVVTAGIHSLRDGQHVRIEQDATP
jgi:RND family efflux transporter MFP subunit